MARNPYLVLGVSQQATGHDIRVAYRTLALRLHPDTGGVDSAPFIEVRRAYDLLRDPGSRRDWDEAHAPYSQRRHATRFSSPPLDLTSASYSAARQARTVAPDLAIASSAESTIETVLDAFDLLAAGFVRDGWPARSQPLYFDLVLTPKEAARGGRFAFTIPLRRHDGEMVEPELQVLVPPRTHDGREATLALDHLGARHGRVTVTIRVE